MLDLEGNVNNSDIPAIPVQFNVNTAVNTLINTINKSPLHINSAATHTNNTNGLNTDVNIPANTLQINGKYILSQL